MTDTAEGVTRSAFGVLEGTWKKVLGSTVGRLSGLEVCRKAYGSEQQMLSSQFGNLLRSKSQEGGVLPNSKGAILSQVPDRESANR